MSTHGSMDYARWAKTGFLFGVALFALGAAGELVGHVVVADLPAWEEQALFYAETVGLAVGFLSPIVFGIVLPLVD